MPIACCINILIIVSEPSFELILASASPRREQLLRQLGLNPDCLAVDIDERQFAGELVEDYVRRLAREKAQAGWRSSGGQCPVIGADTIVVFDNRTLGKPQDRRAVRETLSLLSGQTHQVFSAVAVVWGDFCEVLCSVNEVTFAKIPENWLTAYANSDEPMDKAGCYAIQGRAAIWIKRICGSYSSIMGLPLFETVQLLGQAGFEDLIDFNG